MSRDTTDYDSIFHRRLAKLSDEQLCQIIVHQEDTARQWVVACNKHKPAPKVREHFAEQLRQAQA